MELPKHHETFIPILTVAQRDGPLHYTDLQAKVLQEFYADLPDDLLARRLPSGRRTIIDRIGWGKSYLKKAGLLSYPQRGYVAITDKGKQILARGSYTLKDYKEDVKDEVIKSDASIEDLTYQHEVAEQELLLEKLEQVNPYLFEEIILKLLKKMGYGEMVTTPKSGDGGIDGIIKQDPLGIDLVYIQAKRYTANVVREREIRNFIGAMSSDTSKGVFVTTSDFDEKAKQKAQSAIHKIILINGKELAKLMYEYNVGVQPEQVYTLKKIDNDFFDDE